MEGAEERDGVSTAGESDADAVAGVEVDSIEGELVRSGHAASSVGLASCCEFVWSGPSRDRMLPRKGNACARHW